MKKLLPLAVLLAGLAFSAASCSSNTDAAATASPTTQKPVDVAPDHGDAAGPDTHATGDAHSGGHVYSCPMHPEVASGQPGKCPKCGMALVKKP